MRLRRDRLETTAMRVRSQKNNGRPSGKKMHFDHLPRCLTAAGRRRSPGMGDRPVAAMTECKEGHRGRGPRMPTLLKIRSSRPSHATHQWTSFRATPKPPEPSGKHVPSRASLEGVRVPAGLYPAGPLLPRNRGGVETPETDPPATNVSRTPFPSSDPCHRTGFALFGREPEKCPA